MQKSSWAFCRFLPSLPVRGVRIEIVDDRLLHGIYQDCSSFGSADSHSYADPAVEELFFSLSLVGAWIEMRGLQTGFYQERRKNPRFSHGDTRRTIHTLFTNIDRSTQYNAYMDYKSNNNVF